jgi:oligopeptidase B
MLWVQNDKSAVLIKQEEVQGGYDQSEYASQREWAVSADGARVPVSVVYKKSLFKQDGTNPLLLYGYGSYGYSMDPSFSSARLPLLDRGFVYAIAHIRGGSELGRPWYEDGKLLKKKNTFQDFVAAGRYLHEKKYSSPEKTAIQGGSAGGLLMGAVINLAPDVARAVIAQVPFVDCLNTMMDPTLPLTVTEYEEVRLNIFLDF